MTRFTVRQVGPNTWASVDGERNVFVNVYATERAAAECANRRNRIAAAAGRCDVWGSGR